ncbi:pleiotropic drug resistance protein ABC superfamily [Phytophthora sojae]|uniref:Pleiotropic drug resistance protein ABC superfamily n=1 Tax=Phytophthora sojae (strain P6497) TaxID=1094619 RepID=G4YLX9_PHYSP|nr:pleiotropic drug resistance protein ABC superfamily [Phytophthora sojae]EGZ27174.1 pleiotropic drug resistance protein ABC superfamily [Phytophthora sojae]|eukprot:XP_009514449.1 pleiotropic drug resistance protein ABC superfamily [Phytophthora sojae]
MAKGEAVFYDFVAQQLEPALGRALPQMEVRCKDLSLVVEVPVVRQESSTTASELPSVYNSVKRVVRKLAATKHVTQRHILNRVDAVFEPGTITLVLGQPGSGTSSLMKVLSGQLPMEKNVALQGDLSYNGCTWKELLPKLPQLAAYVPQSDKHFPTLSVQETLEFAHACCPQEVTSRLGKEMLSCGTPEQNETALRAAESLYKNYPDVIVEQLGLQTCRDTVIGNALKRGVSGGERRRVTTGEMEFGMKYATFMDEISTGLDSAATFDIVCTQRDIAKKLHKTVVMALLQPAPEVFELFDNILLLNDGEVMYHGPREHVVPYFESLGFVCPPDHDVADYLLDLGTDQQYQYEVAKASTHASFSVQSPRLASEFADLFRQSEIHQQIMQTLDAPWSDERVRDGKEHLMKMPEFRQSFWAGTLTVMRRQMLLELRNTDFMRVRALMVVVMGLIYGSTFFGFDPTNAQVALGVLYQTTMFLAMGQASQTPVFIAAREIYYKHRRANFYRTSSFAIACLTALVPSAFAECLVFSCFVYWMCGFVGGVGYFLFFLLCMVLTNLALCAWFFTLTAMAPNFNIAKPCSTFSITFYVVFAGFVVPKTQLPAFFLWIYWLNPLAWCLRAVAVNQYRSPKFDVCVYAGEDYCSQYNMTMGEYSLSLYDVPSNKAWVWGGVLFLLFSIAFFVVAGSYILQHKRYDVPAATVAVVASFVDDKEKSELDDIPEEQEQPSRPDGTASYVMVATPRAASSSPAQEEAPSDMVVVDLHEEQARFVPVALAFKDLWYSVPLPHHRHESIDLLKGISGYALPGTMTALMGSSGAGKTTLMDVIAGRKTGGTIQGEILLNGYPATELAIRRCTGYCEQQDIHSEGATIREALTFSAFLRQDSSVSERAKLTTVEECLDSLDLRPIADQIIRGRSQEQMKRLTIGVELAAQPSVLFLDEPTSGMDAHSAKVIMDGVRNVADSGRTVVCTIHQPSSDVFFLFDSLLLLKRGGEMVFFGELDNAQPDDRECGHLIDYFEAIPEVARLPEGQNPATWMLECIGAGVAGAGEKSTADAATNVDFVQHFRESAEQQALLSGLDRPGVTSPLSDVPEMIFKSKRAASSVTQLRMLVARFLTIYWRTPSYNLTRLMISLCLGIVFGLVLVNGEYRTYQGLNAAVGVIFMTTQYNGIAAYVGTLPFTGHERESYYRERASQTYAALWPIPYIFFSGFLFTAPFYPLMSFTTFTTWLLYWVNLSLFVLMQTYLGQLFIYALPSVEVAAIVGVLINAIFLLFAGFNPPAGSIPSGYMWLYHITPQRYSLSILVALLFGNCPEDPTFDEATQTYINVRSELACQPLQSTPLSVGHTTVKGYIADVYNMKYDEVWSNFGCVFIFLFVFRFLSLLALQYINHQKR